MKDNTETISVLLALAALQTPLRHEKYMEIWEQLKCMGLLCGPLHEA